MKLDCLSKTMTEKEALEIASGGGNIFGKILFSKKKITLKLMYLESREIILNMQYKDAPLIKILRKNKIHNNTTQKFRVIVEGTRGGAAYLPQPLETINLEVNEEDIQNSIFSDEKLINSAKYLCRRMIRRQIGKIVESEVFEMKKIYRPYYIAFYGDMKEGKKIRYLPIPADGNLIERTF